MLRLNCEFIGTALAIGLAAASAAGSVASAAIGSHAAGKQADAALKAADANAQLQWRQYEQNRTDLAPWRTAGGNAVTSLASLTAPGGALSKDFTAADFQTDPGYDFRLSEGAKALQRSAASRGNLFSGGTLKDLTQYNQNFASNEYQNAYNRFQTNRNTQFNQLASIAGLGQTAAGQTAQLGTNTVANIGQTNYNAATDAANARAAGTAGYGQAIGSIPGQFANWYMLSQLGRSGGGLNFPT